MARLADWHLISEITGYKAIQMLIAQKCGVKLSIRAVGEYLSRWGYTPQKPTRRAYERNEIQLRAWLKQQYPRIKQRAKHENAEIYWGDETGLRSDGAKSIDSENTNDQGWRDPA